MWIDTTRAHHARTGLCLPSNLTDQEWSLLEPILSPASSAGPPRKWPMRRIELPPVARTPGLARHALLGLFGGLYIGESRIVLR
jgi:transposase